MARIRSIKPEFFASETIAALPITARLTFIGLWTHVDDNGVCLDNVKLVKAAIWPLEDDPTAALERTGQDLRHLERAGLVLRYVAADGKKLLFVTHWDEHQKVSHPRKNRYVRPTPEQFKAASESTASDFIEPPEPLRQSSGEAPEDHTSAPEDLRPEQGSGSREQGEDPPPPDEPADDEGDDEDWTDDGLFEPATGYPAASPSTAPKRAWARADIDADPHWVAFWANYPRKTDKGHARKAWLTALRNGAVPETLVEAAGRFREDPKRNQDIRYIPHPTTWLNGERYNDYAEADSVPAGPRPFWEN